MSKIQTRWNTEDISGITHSIQKLLQPLILEVTTLESTNGVSKKKKGKSMRGSALLATVDKTTTSFIQKAEEIANANPAIAEEMNNAIQSVKTQGENMYVASAEFVKNPCDSGSRQRMTDAARRLLSGVTRVLLTADMVDVYLLIDSIAVLETDLESLKQAKSEDEFRENMRSFDRNAENFLQQAARRQQELNDPLKRDELASARAVLKKHRPLLMTATQTFLQHPNLAGARENRDFVLKQMCEAVNTIHEIAEGTRAGASSSSDNFDILSELTQLERDSKRMLEGDDVKKQDLDCQLDSILSELGQISKSECIPGERKNGLFKACDALRDTLQSVLAEFESNLTNPSSLSDINKKINALKRKLGKAVDQDSFLDANNHLGNLIRAAEQGNLQEFEGHAAAFAEHAEKMIEVANILSNMSNNEDGSKMARYAAYQLKMMYPQMINAARVLAAQPESLPAKKNVEAFREFYENQVKLLVAAIDEITTINDFLSVADTQILEDLSKCFEAIKSGDLETFQNLIDNVRNRIERLTNLVADEMDNYEPCVYTKQVLDALRVLNDEILPNFNKKVQVITENYKKNPEAFDEDDFIDSTNVIYSAIRDVRVAVLMNTPDDELDPEDVEVEEKAHPVILEYDMAMPDYEDVDEYPDVTGIDNARDAMAKLPEAEKKVIQEQVEIFRSEKEQFDREVEKWDETSNNLVTLAKYMSRILMQMTDFTNGQGPLKTTMNLISAAQHISEAGTKFEKLTKGIVEVEQAAKNPFSDELSLYANNINLYCQQLKITSQVKADVQINSGELKISGLDSATSLIKTAKNLMNTVVKIVQTSYLVSLKSKNTKAIVWKRKVPGKKPLVISEKHHVDVVRKASMRKPAHPEAVLSEFHSNSELV